MNPLRPFPRVMFAAPGSGSGKSVITSGLMAALSKKMVVQGFKVGPDYIDTMYHTAATGRPARNLDGWMLSAFQTQNIFQRNAQDADISVIEGVMGLFDGYDGDPLQGSTAGMALVLKTPVVLILDCMKMSASAAAVVHGFHTFSDALPLAGVICNRVGSPQHVRWLKESIEQRNSIPVLGCIPRLETLAIPERHLGLFTVVERIAAAHSLIQQAALTVERHLDLQKIMAIAHAAEPLPSSPTPAPSCTKKQVRLAVAQDDAFCFYYEDNLDELRRCGAEIIPFSPLRDERLPEGISGIYFGGGYPELHAEQLSRNTTMCKQILACCREDMPIYAECGGLMYLTQGLRSAPNFYPLVGALPGWCKMGEKLKMGYREVTTIRPGLLGPSGMQLRGHEFHYSRWASCDPDASSYHVSPRNQGETSSAEGFARGNLLASYIHLHFGQDARLARQFIDQCHHWQTKPS